MDHEVSNSPSKDSRQTFLRIGEMTGVVILGMMLIYFLKDSWRKWPDPIVDFGQQCYCIWQLSKGAIFNHDFFWNYGPLPIFCEAGLFKVFSPGIMVLATANLLIYAMILILAYRAFRIAWGRAGAFAATAVFIAAFSFLHLLAVGNYNYATPYAAESIYGMLLILVSAFVFVRLCSGSSLLKAFLFGSCGGLAALIKPEFMLAMGALGFALVVVRYLHRQSITLKEYLLLFCGIVLPTLVVTVLFAKNRSVETAFIDASRAWWAAVIERVQSTTGQQQQFSGFDHPAQNLWLEIKSTVTAMLEFAMIWCAGWAVNRSWKLIVRVIVILCATGVGVSLRLNGGWFEAGRCFPILMLMVISILAMRIYKETRQGKMASKSTLMELALALLGLAMLARMLLFGHVYHLGFFQAAIAGMVLAAVLIKWLPEWTGLNLWGRGLATAGGAIILVLACGTFANQSRLIRADQTQPVGEGSDRFYSTEKEIDATGFLVDWAKKQLSSTPKDSTVLILPEGMMINYLARHKSLDPGWVPPETEGHYLERLKQAPPDYIIFISRDLSEFGIKKFGAEGNLGRSIVKWVAVNYSVVTGIGADPLGPDDRVGEIILHRKSASQ